MELHVVYCLITERDVCVCVLMWLSSNDTDPLQSTFQLPNVEKLLREFLPLEEAVNELLAPQVNWAPPGYKPTDR